MNGLKHAQLNKCIHIILRGSSQIRSRLGATRAHFWVTCGNPWGSHGVIGVPVAFVLLLVGACPCFWALAGRPFLTWALQPGVPGCQRASKLVPLPVFTFVSHLEVFSDSKRGKWGAPGIFGEADLVFNGFCVFFVSLVLLFSLALPIQNRPRGTPGRCLKTCFFVFPTIRGTCQKPICFNMPTE